MLEFIKSNSLQLTILITKYMQFNKIKKAFLYFYYKTKKIMLLLEEYTVTRIGQKNYKLRLLFKDHSTNIQVIRHIPNIRFEQSGTYYLYYNQYLNRYELRTNLNPNVYHFISILEIKVDLEKDNVIVNDYRKQQSNEENRNVQEDTQNANNTMNIEEDRDGNKDEIEDSFETRSNRGRRRKNI